MTEHPIKYSLDGNPVKHIDTETLIMLLRQALLMMVDAFECWLGISPTTSQITKMYKSEKRKNTRSEYSAQKNGDM